MTVHDYNTYVKQFFSQCVSIMDTKGRDYAPENKVLVDVSQLAATLGISISGVLFVYMWKHVTALRHFMKHKHLKSEDITSRLRDIANYCAMIAVALEHADKLEE